MRTEANSRVRCYRNPNDEAVIRLVGALMLEQSDEWAVSRRHFSLESLAGLVDTDPHGPPALTA